MNFIFYFIFFSALECLQRENDKLRFINSHFKSWSENQTAFLTALKESLISHSHRADVAENQTENSTVQVAGLKWPSTPQSHHVFHVKIGTLIG